MKVTQSTLRTTRKDRDEQKHLVGKHVEAEGQLLQEASQVQVYWSPIIISLWVSYALSEEDCLWPI